MYLHCQNPLHRSWVWEGCGVACWDWNHPSTIRSLSIHIYIFIYIYFYDPRLMRILLRVFTSNLLYIISSQSWVPGCFWCFSPPGTFMVDVFAALGPVDPAELLRPRNADMLISAWSCPVPLIHQSKCTNWHVLWRSKALCENPWAQSRFVKALASCLLDAMLSKSVCRCWGHHAPRQ